MMPELSLDEHSKRLSLYLKGMSDVEIARELSYSKSCIYSWRKKNKLSANVNLRKEETKMYVKPYSQDIREKFLELYELGMTYAEIAREIGISKSTVNRWGTVDYNLEPNYSPDVVGHKYIVKYVDKDEKRAVRLIGFAKNKEIAKRTVLEQLMKSKNKPKDNFVFVSCERRDRREIKKYEREKVQNSVF